jgi:hypothetical protein
MTQVVTNKQQVGPDHVIGGVIHVQIFRDPTISDPQKAFSAQINAPGFSDTFNISNGASQKFSVPVSIPGVPGSPTVSVQVDDFRLLPAGSTAQNATALAFLLVFKIVEFFQITIGSIAVTSGLK